MQHFFVLMQEIAAEKNRGRDKGADHVPNVAWTLTRPRLIITANAREWAGRRKRRSTLRRSRGDDTHTNMRVGWVHVHHPIPPVVPASQVESTTKSCIDLSSALS